MIADGDGAELMKQVVNYPSEDGGQKREMNKPVELQACLLAHNTVLNLFGRAVPAVPLLAGVVTIPFIVRGFGAEHFGVLSLAWAVLGYFAILDLELGPATEGVLQ
ncbi:MAG: hypothetical protein PWQ39_1006 [Thermacetogenium sp.]|nr:hypothetical protein [Thermacetogenium sp.]